MKKPDKAYRVCHAVLCVLYFPLSFFSWLMQMASESAIGVTNMLYVVLIDIFCVISFLIPLLCVGGILLSRFLWKKERSVAAFVVQFIPLAVFVLNLLLLALTDMVL